MTLSCCKTISNEDEVNHGIIYIIKILIFYVCMNQSLKYHIQQNLNSMCMSSNSYFKILTSIVFFHSQIIDQMSKYLMKLNKRTYQSLLCHI